MLNELVSITTALADENRVRVLLALRGGELCLCQITELLGLANSTVSKHVSILRGAKLVESRKAGRWIHCRLADRDATPAARKAIDWVCESLARDVRAREDARKLKEILACDPEELCRRQSKRSGCCSSAPAIRAGARWPRGGRAASRAT